MQSANYFIFVTPNFLSKVHVLLYTRKVLVILASIETHPGEVLSLSTEASQSFVLFPFKGLKKIRQTLAIPMAPRCMTPLFNRSDISAEPLPRLSVIHS